MYQYAIVELGIISVGSDYKNQLTPSLATYILHKPDRVIYFFDIEVFSTAIARRYCA
jgi:hypothetical protein